VAFVRSPINTSVYRVLGDLGPDRHKLARPELFASAAGGTDGERN
jgi:hypothetical protein